MTTELKTRGDGKINVIFTREKDNLKRCVGLTEGELLYLQMQISTIFRDKLIEEDLRKQADAIILDRDPNFVTREVAERKYTHKNNRYEVYCETKSEQRVWIFEVNNNKLEYKRYEGDFKG